jgi:hypothetical protein
MADDLRVRAALIVAVFDLIAVRSITNAVAVNTLKRGGRMGPLGNIENPKPPPSLPNFGEQSTGTVPLHPPMSLDAPIARRRDVEPTIRCGHRVTPRATDVAPTFIPTDDTLPATDAERASGLPSKRESPLAPPWAMPLPIQVPPEIRVVKWEAARADQVSKGLLLDFFM